MRTSSQTADTEANDRGLSAIPVFDRKSSRVYRIALLLVLVFFACMRFRLRNIPLERDEGEYAYMGQLMLQGIPPYQLAANMKLPGTYAAYALMMAIFGQSASGVHLGLLIVNAATIALMYVLGRRLCGPLCGIVAATVYALLSARLSVLGLSAHATHFVVFFALTGIVAYLRAVDSDRKSWLFASGLLLGTAFLMKQPGILFVVFLGFDLITRVWKLPSSTGLGKKLAIYVAGAVLPFALTCLVLLFAGVFRNFWFWTFTFASEYASSTSVSAGWNAFRNIFFVSIARPRAVWVLAAIGLLSVAWNRKRLGSSEFLFSFTFFSFLAVCPGFYFRPHYFILMLPAVSLLCGIAISEATEYLRTDRYGFVPVWLPTLAFVLFCGIYIVGQRKILWQMSPLEVCRDEYPSEPYPEAVSVASYLKAEVPEGNTIAILGSEPEIYFYSHRHSATTYIYTHPFSEDQPYAELMQEHMIKEIENSKPAALVYVDDQLSWGWTAKSRPERVFTWMRQYVPANYELAARFPFSGSVEHLEGASPSLTVYLRKP